jgi:kynurenine formamidase
MAISRVIDLSHRIADGSVTYPGLPAPSITWDVTHEQSRANYDEGTEFSFVRLNMTGNTGTYLDSPLHRFEGGADVTAFDLDRLVSVPALVVRFPEGSVGWPAIDADALAGLDLAGKAVLIHTGWASRFGTPQYVGGHPYLTEAAAAALVAAGVAVVGIDSLNIDSTAGGTRPAHTTLLAAGVPIVEHLRGLELLPDAGFAFSAIPLNFERLATSPVRAVAVV